MSNVHVMFRRVLVTAALALVPFAGLPTPWAIGATVVAPAVVYADDFCTVDPPVTFTTPHGNVVTVYLTVGVYGLIHLPALQAVQDTFVTAQNDDNTTEVKLGVLVPSDATGQFNYTATVSSAPNGLGTVYVSTGATAGTAKTLEFKLNVP